MVVPGEGYVDKGRLMYFGGKPFVADGQFQTSCPHSKSLGLNSKGEEIYEMPLSFVIFIGHPEEYKTQGICVLCAVQFVLDYQKGT